MNGVVKNIEEAIDFITRIKNDSTLWAISLKDNPELIGTITFWKIKKEHYKADIVHILHPDQQGKGIMKEAIKAGLKFEFCKN